jgi:hypothetical protein
MSGPWKASMALHQRRWSAKHGERLGRSCSRPSDVRQITSSSSLRRHRVVGGSFLTPTAAPGWAETGTLRRAFASQVPDALAPPPHFASAVLQLDDEARPTWKVGRDRLEDIFNNPWLVPRKGTGKFIAIVRQWFVRLHVVSD